jgi:hypothetical protein
MPDAANIQLMRMGVRHMATAGGFDGMTELTGFSFSSYAHKQRREERGQTKIGAKKKREYMRSSIP